MSLATVNDVEARLGRVLDESEHPRISTLLSDAEALILSRIPDLFNRIAEGRLSEELVIMIEANSVARILRNPEGIKSQAAEGFQVEYDSRAASGFLSILRDEWRLLGVSRGLFVIKPVLPEPTTGG